MSVRGLSPWSKQPCPANRIIGPGHLVLTATRSHPVTRSPPLPPHLPQDLLLSASFDGTCRLWQILGSSGAVCLQVVDPRERPWQAPEAPQVRSARLASVMARREAARAAAEEAAAAAAAAAAQAGAARTRGDAQRRPAAAGTGRYPLRAQAQAGGGGGGVATPRVPAGARGRAGPQGGSPGSDASGSGNDSGAPSPARNDEWLSGSDGEASPPEVVQLMPSTARADNNVG